MYSYTILCSKSDAVYHPIGSPQQRVELRSVSIVTHVLGSVISSMSIPDHSHSHTSSDNVLAYRPYLANNSTALILIKFILAASLLQSLLKLQYCYLHLIKKVNASYTVKLRCVAYGSGGLLAPIMWTSVTNGRTSTIGNSTSTRVIIIVPMAAAHVQTWSSISTIIIQSHRLFNNDIAWNFQDIML